MLLIFWSVVLTLGCNYKTLKFFFDGVPDPKKKNPPIVQDRTGAAVVKTSFSEHTPYAAKECDACHNRASSNNLIAPKGELCFICHDFPAEKRYVHGPLASGGCLVCHDPHSSKYPTLLVSEPATFCFYCHDPGAIPKDKSHSRKDIQCTVCHDAHMSDKKFLLK